MYEFVECSKELKSKRVFENIELNFSEKEKSLTIKNKKINTKVYKYLSDYYLNCYSECILSTENIEDGLKIFFHYELDLLIAKQDLIFKIDEEHDDNYYLIEELKKWEI